LNGASNNITNTNTNPLMRMASMTNPGGGGTALLLQRTMSNNGTQG
jgi:hypothetical protein